MQEEIDLKHRILSKGIEVNHAKIIAIEKFTPPKNMKGILSWTCELLQKIHIGFFWDCKILCNLLEKYVVFNFDGDCLQAFKLIKKKLTAALIFVVPNWSQQLEIMYDDSDCAFRVVLGRRLKKTFQAIHYANRTFNSTQQNYTKKKRILVVVFAFDKFKLYIICSKVVVFMNILPSVICVRRKMKNLDWFWGFYCFKSLISR